MEGNSLRALRKQRGWTQQQVAARLGISQAYLSMLEGGRRAAPARIMRALARMLDLPATAMPLPVSAAVLADTRLAGALAGLGYPGFAHLGAHAGRRRNPAEVLAAALRQRSLDARLTEALPWLAVSFYDLDWSWLVRQAKLHDFQNRLGYVALLARQHAEASDLPAATRRLREVEQTLEPSRLAGEGSFAGDALTKAERRWLRQQRPVGARHWNLLTDLTAETLPYAH